MEVLRHGAIMAPDRIIVDGYIAFDKTILSIGEDRDIPAEYASLPYEDMKGYLIMPGMCNTHTHLGMISFRSLGDDIPDRLHRFLMPLENMAMTEELTAASASIAIAEMIRAGITSAVDMYYYEDAIAAEAQRIGFRLWAGETILDAPHPGAEDFAGSIERTCRCIEKCSESELTEAIIAPHAPYSLSFDHLLECRELARKKKLLWTMHLEEMTFEMEAFRRKYSTTPIKLLEKEGALDDSLIAVHLLLVDDEDKEILKERSVSIAHCPGSNAKAAKGVAPITDLIGSVPVTLGTDGPASGNTLDIFTQMKCFAYLHKNRTRDRSAFPASSIVPLATREAGKALHADIGELREGHKADIIAISLEEPETIPCCDPYSVIVYSASPECVKHVWINGRKLLSDRVFTNLDLNEEKRRFREASKDFFRKAEEL